MYTKSKRQKRLSISQMNMEQIYTDTTKILKALSERKCLRIVDMLSCGELCACEILEEFHITQPTLSHDMKLHQTLEKYSRINRIASVIRRIVKPREQPSADNQTYI